MFDVRGSLSISLGMKSLQKILTLVAAGFILFIFTGCASIVSGRQQTISFTSSPDDAVVTIDGKPIGKTPISTQLQRKGSSQIVTLEKPGYKTVTFQIKATVNGWFFGNLIFGGLLGSSTDSSTGAINAYSQDMYNFSLNPIDNSTLTARTEVKSFVITNYKNIFEELNARPRTDNSRTAVVLDDAPKPYLESLFTLMKVQPAQKDSFTKLIKTLANQNNDIVNFAEKVAALLP